MRIIGTELYDKGFESAVAEFIDLVQQAPKNLIVSASDANVLVQARSKADIRKIVDACYWNLPDGVPSVWISKLKGSKTINRCSGPDFFKRIILESKSLNVNHYLCGGAPEVANELNKVCQTWGNKNIVGTFCPPFKDLSDEEYQEIANDINAKGTNVLWVGLGTPKQLYFSYKISKLTNVQFILPVGAAFDFHTGRVKQAPKWIQKSGIEWLYRIFQEPRRLTKRYLNVIPNFIYYNLLDR